MFLYHFLDFFFLIFHTILTLFNLLGWIWKKTRLANFISLLLTGFAWFGLGIFYGIGYCPLTDWHWDVLEKLGVKNLPDSYITYIIQRLTGIRMNDQFVEAVTLICFIVALFMSVYLNFFRKKLKVC